MPTRDPAPIVFAFIGTCVGATLGGLVVFALTHASRTCTLDERQLARLAATAPAPVAVPAPTPTPTPLPPEPMQPPPAEPPPPSWRVDEAKTWRWDDGKPGFALRVDLAMTRLRETASDDGLRAKTTCTIGELSIVETVGFAAPPGKVLVGERAIGTFIDPFYWKRLDQVPTRCDLHFTADGAEAGRFCVTIADPMTVAPTACPVDVEAPLPQDPEPK